MPGRAIPAGLPGSRRPASLSAGVWSAASPMAMRALPLLSNRPIRNSGAARNSTMPRNMIVIAQARETLTHAYTRWRLRAP